VAPAPGRIFMALAAAHFQIGADPAEREALTWLERLEEAPAIRAGILPLRPNPVQRGQSAIPAKPHHSHCVLKAVATVAAEGPGPERLPGRRLGHGGTERR
jgi:hypothetical protein